MIKVWILIAFMGTTPGYNSSHGGPIVVDNLATQQQCEFVREQMLSLGYAFQGRCISVWKARVGGRDE